MRREVSIWATKMAAAWIAMILPLLLVPAAGAQAILPESLQYTWTANASTTTGQLGKYVIASGLQAPRPATYSITWTPSGTAPSACTFNAQGSNDNVTWFALDGGSAVSCTASGHEFISASPVLYLRINLASFTAGDGTTVVTFSYVGGPQAAGATGTAAITGGTIDNTVIGGTTPAAGNFTTVTATGNVSVQGTLSSATNTQPASITNTGTAIGAATNNTNVQYFNAAYTANNRIAEHIWFQNCLQTRFKNDSQAGAVVPFSVCGGYGTGITGITSNSGFGSWVHTGPFSATGPVTGSNIPAGTIATALYGTTGSIGGSLLTAGTCSSGTVAVTGAVVGHTVGVSSSDGTLPNALATLSASVTATNTVSVQVCAIAAVTPTAKTYNVSTY